MPLEVYALSDSTATKRASSSGGAFLKIVQAFFRVFAVEKKAVYGATFDQQMNVVHDVAYTLEECEKFCGSKYVRSTIADTYTNVKNHLEQGGAVLFSGTPCQVYALKCFLERNAISQEKLLCVDLICHGCPKPAYWEAYRDWLQTKHRSKLTGFLFRSKGDAANPYGCQATFENGKVLTKSLDVSLYNRLFLRNYIFLDGCFRCAFASLERQGDITLGDFWGIETVMPNYPIKDHVSEILVNTSKGKWMFDDLKAHLDETVTIMPCTSDEYIQYQNNLQKPAQKPDRYEAFQQDYANRGLVYVLKRYVGYDFKHRLQHTILSLLRR